MGQSTSKNVTDLTIKAIAKVSSSIVQNTGVTTDSTQIISVSHSDHDVIISGNTFTTKATINMQALSKALSSQRAQQELAAELSQVSKSITSGINLFQFSDASNTINNYLSTVLQMTSEINQTCSILANTSQVIDVSFSKGNVKITNNVFNQMSEIFQSCIQNAVSENVTLQSIEDKIKQSAIAESKGFSIWAIVIIVVVALFLFVSPLIGLETLLVRFLFPIIMFAGVVLIVLFYTTKKDQVSSIGFSKLIKNATTCVATPAETVTNVKTAGQAAEILKTTKNYVAYDWQGITVNEEDGTWTELQPPQTTFYTSLAPKNCPELSTTYDNTKLTRVPLATQGSSDPDPKAVVSDGDLYLNNTSGEYFQKKKQTWVSVGNFPHQKGTLVVWGPESKLPTNPNKNDIFVVYDSIHYTKFNVHMWDGKEWKINSIDTPGLVPTIPKTINFSGYKVQSERTWMLGVGIGLVALGLFGTIYTFILNKRKPSQKVKPSKK